MTIERKTLVILTPGFPENEEDSTCLPMQQQLVRSLKERYSELDIRIITFQYPYHRREYTWFGIPVIPFAGRNKGGISKLLLRKKIMTALRSIHESSEIAGLLSFWYGECAFMGKRFGEKMGIRHFCWVLGQDAKKDNKYPGKVRLAANELIALSDFLQDEFERNHRIRPGAVIPPGIDTSQFSSNTANRSIDILGVGSLIPLKRFNEFIGIVAEIKKHYPKLNAVLVGKGPEMDQLRALIKRLGLESTLTLTGEIPHDQVIKLMQKTKVFLHPSSYEGFGMVCLEAVGAGVHTISFVKPMREEISGWRIVKTAEEMTRVAMEILSVPYSLPKPITGFEIETTAKKFMGLFEGYRI